MTSADEIFRQHLVKFDIVVDEQNGNHCVNTRFARVPRLGALNAAELPARLR